MININNSLSESGIIPTTKNKEKKSIVAKRPKRHRITDEQRQFAIEICKERNKILDSSLRYGEDLYKFLIDLYYETYDSIAPVKDHFPFSNVLQQHSVQDYEGDYFITRTYKSKKCTHPAFGCSGQCSESYKNLLQNRIEKNGGSLEHQYEGLGFCWLMIQPYDKNIEIMESCVNTSQAAAANEMP